MTPQVLYLLYRRVLHDALRMARDLDAGWEDMDGNERAMALQRLRLQQWFCEKMKMEAP